METNTLIFQPVQRVVKNAGWTRTLYLTYMDDHDGLWGPVVLCEGEGRALAQAIRHKGQTIRVHGDTFGHGVFLDPVKVDGKTMTEYRHQETLQSQHTDRVGTDGSAYDKVRQAAREFFQARVPA